MSSTAQYALQALFWIVLMAALGLVARPLINKLDNDKGDR